VAKSGQNKNKEKVNKVKGKSKNCCIFNPKQKINQNTDKQSDNVCFQQNQ